MDEVTWGALALTLTLLGAGYTWWAFRHRGPAAGTRGAAFTLLPAAFWLTGTLEMVTEIAGSVADWATRLVLSPLVWLGLGLAGLSVVLLVVARMIPDRTRTERGAPSQPGALPPGGQARTGGVVDDDMAEIEAILRKRGIS